MRIAAVVRRYATPIRPPSGFAEPAETVGNYDSTAGDEREFHRRMHENPHDRTTPLVYADWLDERGRSGLAGLIRSRVRRSTDGGVPDEPATQSYRHAEYAHPERANYFSLGYVPPASQTASPHASGLFTLAQLSRHDPREVFQWSGWVPGQSIRETADKLRSEGFGLAGLDPDVPAYQVGDDDRRRVGMVYPPERPPPAPHQLARTLRRYAATDRGAFEAAIDKDPTNPLNHHVYSDWLRDNGEEGEADFRKAMGDWIGRGPTATDPFRPPSDTPRSFQVYDGDEDGFTHAIRYPKDLPDWASSIHRVGETRHGETLRDPALAYQPNQYWIHWRGYRNMEECLRRAFHANRQPHTPSTPGTIPEMSEDVNRPETFAKKSDAVRRYASIAPGVNHFGSRIQAEMDQLRDSPEGFNWPSYLGMQSHDILADHLADHGDPREDLVRGRTADIQDRVAEMAGTHSGDQRIRQVSMPDGTALQTIGYPRQNPTHFAVYWGGETNGLHDGIPWYAKGMTRPELVSWLKRFDPDVRPDPVALGMTPEEFPEETQQQLARQAGALRRYAGLYRIPAGGEIGPPVKNPLFAGLPGNFKKGGMYESGAAIEGEPEKKSQAQPRKFDLAAIRRKIKARKVPAGSADNEARRMTRAVRRYAANPYKKAENPEHEPYNQAFRDRARQIHDSLPAAERAAHRPALDRFNAIDHMGLLIGYAKGDEGKAHDAALRLLYGTDRQTEGAFFKNYDPAKGNLAQRFVAFGRHEVNPKKLKDEEHIQSSQMEDPDDPGSYFDYTPEEQRVRGKFTGKEPEEPTGGAEREREYRYTLHLRPDESFLPHMERLVRNAGPEGLRTHDLWSGSGTLVRLPKERVSRLFDLLRQSGRVAWREVIRPREGYGPVHSTRFFAPEHDPGEFTQHPLQGVATRVAELRADGLSWQKIAKELGRSVGGVFKLNTLAKQHGWTPESATAVDSPAAPG